jgi:hypothetical protein
MSDFNGLYNIRIGKDSDKNLILSTFLKGLYYGSIDSDTPSNTMMFGMVPKQIFFDRYKRVAQALVNDPNMTIRVACLPEDEDVVIGYSIVNSSEDTLFWVFVKSAWRKRGIARNLVKNKPKYVAHLNLLGKTLMNKLTDTEFNPFF